MGANPSNNNADSAGDAEHAGADPQELTFMRPIEDKPQDEDKPKLSRAERRAAKPQAKGFGKVQNMRNQATQNQRNFANRRSG
jgi:hypothetical protein